MPAADVEAWRRWRARHGFPADRIAWATAIGASYVGATWGGKARPSDLMPKIENPADKRRRMRAFFDGLEAAAEQRKRNGGR